MKTMLYINHDHMGHGDVELGQKLLRTFLKKSGALKGLDAVAFVNTGVKLVAWGSPILPELSQLIENGVDLLACGTCLDHFEIEATVGDRSDMDSILKEMDAADKVITL